MPPHTRLMTLLIPCFLMGGCVGVDPPTNDDGSSTQRERPLSALPTDTIAIPNQQIDVWVAKNNATRTEGMMFVTEDEVADNQGMLFVFPDERFLGFWMRNTLIPLDIAYARFDGTVVTIHQMPPLTLRTFPSLEPAMFALEMKAGSFERIGLTEGTVLQIPDDVLKDVE